MLRGVRSMQRKERGAEVRNRANIQWETVRTRPSKLTMLEGRATAGCQLECLTSRDGKTWKAHL